MTISGIGFRRADGEGFPSVANVLCWDDHNETWLHTAHVKLTKPGTWQIYRTVIPRVSTTALTVCVLSENKAKHTELGQILLYSE